MIEKINIKSFLVGVFLLFLAVLFFFSVSSFNYFTQEEGFVKWLSPDETANYVVSKLYGQEGQMIIFEKYNLYVDDIMRPRSFRSDHGDIKPVSFLGIIIIFGYIVKLAGYKLLPFLTPAFAALGIIFYYLLIKKIFSRNVALISSVVLAFFPVYIYYSARSMFHNVLFLVFFIISLYFTVGVAGPIKTKDIRSLLKNKILAGRGLKNFWAEKLKYFLLGRPDKKRFFRLLCASLAGLFLGLAAMARTSELIWIGPLFAFLYIFNFRRINLLALLLFGAFFVLGILPMLFYNQILYSSPFLGGYAEMNQSIINIKQAGSELVKIGSSPGLQEAEGGPWQKLKESIFYFGLQPGQSYLRFKYYFVHMFPWLFWPALAGALIPAYKMFRERSKKYFNYFSAYFILSFILIIYYGSWGFTDNPDPNSFTIGNSYTRYWLPVYLGAIPFFSILLLSISSLISSFLPQKTSGFFNFRLKKNILKWSSVITVLAFTSLSSLSFVLFGSEEGLAYVAQRQRSARLETRQVLDLTEPNSAIITFYHEKLLFPERKVVVGLFDDNAMLERYGKMLEYIPVYYYNFSLPEKDLQYLNSRRLLEFGMQIEVLQKVNSDFTLYKLRLIE